ncbi:MAG: T9SS type A sorting domain-containing protein [Balneolaceae bacterium]
MNKILWVLLFFSTSGYLAPTFGQTQLHIQLPDTTVELEESTTTILMPVTIQHLPENSISGFRLKLQFDPDVVAIESFSKNGTLSSGFSIFGNSDTDETFIISGAGSTPIYDDGVLINLEILVKGAGTSPIEFLEVEINEGEPAFTYTNGNVTVGSPEPIPEAPALVFPESDDDEVEIPLTLSWENVSGAANYEVQLSDSDEFSSLLVDESTTTNSFDVDDLEYLTQYFWRVRAGNESGKSDWSETFNFTTKEKENESPTVSNPLGSVILQEDFGEKVISELGDVFSDDENISLSFEIVDFPADLLTARISENSSLVLVSVKNQYGSGQVIVAATDTEEASVNDTLTVVIEPVNDLPVFVGIPDTLTFKSGEEYTFEFGDIVDDVEDDLSDLSFNFVIEPDELTFDISITSHKITISASDFVGQGLLTLLVKDSGGGEVEESIILIIESSTSSNLEQDIPSEFKLSQNYPNPFNPTTQIQYQLPKASAVSLRVFDATGRIAYDYSHLQKAAGTHTFTFNASALSSGFYFYQLKAGEFVQTQKMTLIK